MLYINKITDDPMQELTLTGIPQVSIDMKLRYLPRMRLWMMDLAYQDISVKGMIVVTSANMLRAFRNVLPFGICCFTTNGLDPYNIDDFSLQASDLYLLDAADVAALEEAVFAA